VTCDLARHWCAVLAVFVGAVTLSTLALCGLATLGIVMLIARRSEKLYAARRAEAATRDAATEQSSGVSGVDQK